MSSSFPASEKSRDGVSTTRACLLSEHTSFELEAFHPSNTSLRLHSKQVEWVHTHGHNPASPGLGCLPRLLRSFQILRCADFEREWSAGQVVCVNINASSQQQMGEFAVAHQPNQTKPPLTNQVNSCCLCDRVRCMLKCHFVIDWFRCCWWSGVLEDNLFWNPF